MVPDVAVGRAKADDLFTRVPSVATLYNYIDKRLVRTTNFDLTAKVFRNTHKQRTHSNLKQLGTSIEERPIAVEERSRLGDWEIDTVQGIKGAGEPVLLTLTERMTRFELIFKLNSKSVNPVTQVMTKLSAAAGANFAALFKTITADNGAEFTNLIEAVKATTGVYYTHPYAAYERGTNERHNRMIRSFSPKGKSMKDLPETAVKRIQPWLNALPRKQFGYQTPAELMLKRMRELVAAGA